MVRVRPYVWGLLTTSFPDQHRRCAGFIKPATSLAMKTTKCPESLCPVLRYLHWRGVSHLLGGRCPSLIAPTDSERCGFPMVRLDVGKIATISQCSRITDSCGS